MHGFPEQKLSSVRVSYCNWEIKNNKLELLIQFS